MSPTDRHGHPASTWGVKLIVLIWMAWLAFLSPSIAYAAGQKEAAENRQPHQALLALDALEDDFTQNPLKPPDTSSPRATLQSFLQNMNTAYGALMRAHRDNMKSPGLMTPETIAQEGQRAESIFQRAVHCLDLSDIPEKFKQDVGYEGAIKLKEIFDRIALPPWEDIPDLENLENEAAAEIDGENNRWAVPNTEIVIARVEEGPRTGEYLFTPETVSRLDEFYAKVKKLPYKNNALISLDFYNFYITTPGALLPPRWYQYLPAWSTAVYFDQTIWQWLALMILPVLALLMIWMAVRWWHRRSADLSSGKKSAGWIGVIVFTAVTIMLIKYILDEIVNITGPVLAFVQSTLQVIFFIVLGSLMMWEVMKSHIGRKVGASEPEEGEMGEGMGTGGTRGETLLLLLRKIFMAVVFTVVGLILLSAMGINIGPLLAGAGVIGLAVGFGSQKLVSDVLSGIFFLMDDAFRVGEYIKAGGNSGTVEAITLRNVMLRHHRGMLQIIPFSELGSITNFMRGALLVKFNLQLPYDTDIDKVRKIIKKVGKKMLNDPELGPAFVEPVKSQGVRSVGDSVMTFRVKFAAVPGKHFVIRREAFRRITEALEAKGIHYAHRKVIVEMPAEEENGQVCEPQTTAAQVADTDPQSGEPPASKGKDLLAGAAAGLEAIINQEDDKAQKSKKK